MGFGRGDGGSCEVEEESMMSMEKRGEGVVKEEWEIGRGREKFKAATYRAPLVVCTSGGGAHGIKCHRVG